MQQLWYCVAHPLTGRYMHGRVQWKKESERGKSKSAL
ncbi:lactoylglutathione lyase [Vibrio parahaemolyticus]|nr:lactoylglutathione lyase [Vibrio parahaemolyticus]